MRNKKEEEKRALKDKVYHFTCPTYFFFVSKVFFKENMFLQHFITYFRKTHFEIPANKYRFCSHRNNVLAQKIISS